MPDSLARLLQREAAGEEPAQAPSVRVERLIPEPLPELVEERSARAAGAAASVDDGAAEKATPVAVARPRPGRSWGRWLAVLVVLLIAGGAGAYVWLERGGDPWGAMEDDEALSDQAVEAAAEAALGLRKGKSKARPAEEPSPLGVEGKGVEPAGAEESGDDEASPAEEQEQAPAQEPGEAAGNGVDSEASEEEDPAPRISELELDRPLGGGADSEADLAPAAPGVSPTGPGGDDEPELPGSVVSPVAGAVDPATTPQGSPAVQPAAEPAVVEGAASPASEEPADAEPPEVSKAAAAKAKKFNAKGLRHYKKGRMHRALKSYLKALTYDPGYHKAHFNAACMYALKENVRKVVHHLLLFQKHSPTPVDLQRWVARDSDFEIIREDPQFTAWLARQSP